MDLDWIWKGLVASLVLFRTSRHCLQVYVLLLILEKSGTRVVVISAGVLRRYGLSFPAANKSLSDLDRVLVSQSTRCRRYE